MSQPSMRHGRENAYVLWFLQRPPMVENPERLKEIAESLTGRQVQDRINFWMDRFFRFISIPWKRDAKKLVEQPSQIEAGYQAIHQGFNQLAQALALV